MNGLVALTRIAYTNAIASGKKTEADTLRRRLLALTNAAKTPAARREEEAA